MKKESFYFVYFEYKVNGVSCGTETTLLCDLPMDSEDYYKWRGEQIEDFNVDEGTFIIKCFSKIS
jgi:hypothetical protein